MDITNRDIGVFRHAIHVMDACFEVIIAGIAEEKAVRAAKSVIEEWKRMHNLFNRFDPDSEISRINKAAAGRPVIICEDVMACLEIAERIREDTRGAFNIDVAATSTSGLLEADRCECSSGFRVKIRKGEREQAVSLDLGGIAKGFALEMGREILEGWGIERALLLGGTSTVLALGTPSENEPGWLVSMAGGWDCPSALTRIWLRDRALSASGTRKRGLHIQDPTTGMPAQGHLAAWAIHPSAAVADAMSTAFMVLETGRVKILCDRDIQLGALVITPAGVCRIFNPESFI